MRAHDDRSCAMQGFKRVMDSLEDVCLDYPSGETQFQECVTVGTAEGWLDGDWNEQEPHTAPNGLASPNSPRIRVSCERYC